MSTSIVQSLYFDQLLVLLAATVVVAPLAKFLRTSTVLVYLLMGLTLGPFGLSVIGQVEDIQPLAELGIVFLLFMIGLEISLDRFRVMYKSIFGLGGLQVFITSLVLGLLVASSGLSPSAAVVIGGALALSSTAFALQLLSDRNETSARYGRASVATLLFQDLAVVPLIVILPLLQSSGLSVVESLAVAAVKAVAVLGVILLTGQAFLRPMYQLIASSRRPEVFTALTLLLVLGTGMVVETQGLSMALGAFLAGVLLSGTEFRHQVAADMDPFKGLLLGLFFMTVGMQIDLSILISQPLLMLSLVLGLIVIKTSLLFALGNMFGLNKYDSLRYGVMLSQGGEFAFVILGLAVTQMVVPAGVAQVLLVVVTLSMALTPLLVQLVAQFAPSLEDTSMMDLDFPTLETSHKQGHVIIAGFGRHGQRVARMLQDEGLDHVALDLDHQLVKDKRTLGFSVFYGNAMDSNVLTTVGVEMASAVVIALDQEHRITQCVEAVRALAPQIKVYCLAKNVVHAQQLDRLGVRFTVPEDFQVSLELGAAVLRDLVGNEEVYEVKVEAL